MRLEPRTQTNTSRFVLSAFLACAFMLGIYALVTIGGGSRGTGETPLAQVAQPTKVTSHPTRTAVAYATHGTPNARPFLALRLTGPRVFAQREGWRAADTAPPLATFPAKAEATTATRASDGFTAGLRTRERDAERRLLLAASQPEPVLTARFVLTYRCGAVPDSHRVPFHLSTRPGTANEGQHIGVRAALSTIGWGIRLSRCRSCSVVRPDSRLAAAVCFRT